MTVSGIHRIHNRICCGDFLWNGLRYAGSHEALISSDLFDG